MGMRLGCWTIVLVCIAGLSNGLKLQDSLRMARCFIPNDIKSVTRAVLLQQCISKNQAQGNETVCYQELGCFPMTSPWTTILRPFPSPMHPDEIKVKLYLHTRNHPKRYEVPLWPSIELGKSDFYPSREKTVFITHGFANNGDEPWMSEMKDAYLQSVDANVFIVDWGSGASRLNYLRVASNTRIVGAELARFGKYLIRLGVDPSHFHLIGHSLGAQISSYFAKNLAESGTGLLGRVTALDPAQPGFEGEAKEVRLDADDAEFVDVLHTDAKPFIPFFGFGMLSPVGHVDFYLNGGTNQPGCYSNITHLAKNVKGINDLATIPVEVLSEWVACSHGRSYQVFTSSLRPGVTCLWARKIPRMINAIKVGSQGALRLLDPIAEKLESCKQDSCTVMGFLTPTMKARGIFTMSTTKTDPFCVSDAERDRKLKNLLSLGLFKLGSTVLHVGTSMGSRVVGGISSVGSVISPGISSIFG